MIRLKSLNCRPARFNARKIAGSLTVAGLLMGSSCAVSPKFATNWKNRNSEPVAQQKPHLPGAPDVSAVESAKTSYAEKLEMAKKESQKAPVVDSQLQHAVVDSVEKGNAIQKLSYEEPAGEASTAGKQDDAATAKVASARPWAPDLGNQPAAPAFNDTALISAVCEPACPRVDLPPGVCPPAVQMVPPTAAAGVCSTARPMPTEDGGDEYICDGGDAGYPVHYENGKIAGIESEDTVAEFVDENGERHVKPSNQVCVYAPRFGVARSVTDAIEEFKVEKAGGTHDGVKVAGTVTREVIDEKADVDGLVAMRQRERLGDVRGRQAEGVETKDVTPDLHVKLINAFEDYGFLQTGRIDDGHKAGLMKLTQQAAAWIYGEAPRVVAKDVGGQSLTALFKAAEVIGLEDGRSPAELRIVKAADKGSAQIGETVRFSIRFDNLGGHDLTEVRIIDNLSPRLELVESSVNCDLPGELEINDNGELGQLMTFRLDGSLKGKTGGAITFECIVR
jgi:uncharacterized repeat protein (TIGR01451 family)